jgi:hypothetical protein
MKNRNLGFREYHLGFRLQGLWFTVDGKEFRAKR